MTRTRVVAVTALSALLLPDPPLAAQRHVFSSRTLGVRVDVLVTDGRTPVAGLKAADFELRDNGVPQSVQAIEAQDLPINVVLALDVSTSIAGRRKTELVGAASVLLDGLRSGDRAALTTFSHAARVPVPLTEDLSSVRRAVERITPLGETSLLDGAYVALMATQAQSGRSLVVLCTDGGDTASWLDEEELVETAKRANAVLYAVTSVEPRRQETLRNIVDATGGQILRASGADFTAAFRRIITEFRSRYVLSYSPQGVDAGGYHRLEVRVRRSGLTVKARPGYIGVTPQP